MNLRRLIILDPIIEPIHKSEYLLNIKIPNTCPICGEKPNGNEIKLHSRYYISDSKFLKVKICKKHYKYFKKNPNIIFYSTIFIPLLLFSLFFYYLYINIDIKFSLDLLLAAIISLSLPVASIVYMSLKLDKNFREYLNIKAFKKGIVIIGQNNTWFDEFKKLNSCYELPEDKKVNLKKIEKSENRKIKILSKSATAGGILFLLFIITLFIWFSIVSMIFAISSILLLFIYKFISLHCIRNKIKKKKSKIYFDQ